MISAILPEFRPITLILFVLIAIVLLYLNRVKPDLFDITVPAIPKRWSIGMLLKLTAILSVSLSFYLIFGIVAAVVFLLICIKIMDSSV